MVVALLNAIGAYFSAARQEDNIPESMEGVVEEARGLCQRCRHQGAKVDAQLAELVEAFPGLQDEIAAMLVLARSGESLVNPIFSRTTAIGTLMRKKIEPVTTPLVQQLSVLRRFAST